MYGKIQCDIRSRHVRKYINPRLTQFFWKALQLPLLSNGFDLSYTLHCCSFLPPLDGKVDDGGEICCLPVHATAAPSLQPVASTRSAEGALCPLPLSAAPLSADYPLSCPSCCCASPSNFLRCKKPQRQKDCSFWQLRFSYQSCYRWHATLKVKSINTFVPICRKEG